MALSPFLAEILSQQKNKGLFQNSSEETSDLQILEDLPIDSWQDYKKFFYLRQHLPQIFKELTHKNLSIQNLKDLIGYILQFNLPIHNILNLYKSVQQAIEDLFNLSLAPKYPEGDLSIKIAYPEGELPEPLPFYNIPKWIEAAQYLKQLLVQNVPFSKAFEYVTQNWDINELMDFSTWLKYYQNLEHMKYKTAQNFLYDQVSTPTLPKATIPNFGRKEKQPLSTTERIEKSIKSILGRLNAAEKLSTNPEVRATLQEMLGGKLDLWLSNLHTLKRQLQVAPWKVVAAYSSLNINEIDEEVTNSLLSDLIYREAFKTSEKDVSKFLLKLAQAVSTPNLPIPTPPIQTTPPEDAENLESEEEVMQEIISKMNPEVDEDDNQSVDEFGNLEVRAQALPQALPQRPTVRQPKPVEQADSEDLIEKALGQVTIREIVDRLEAVASIFRKREVPRQLSIIDLMMDKLNIATFFPSLAEAAQKSLDSNQYALTRIEDILSKLRGSLMIPDHHQVSLGPDREEIPTTGVQKILTEDAAKQREQRALEQKQMLAPTPPLQVPQAPPISNVTQDLSKVTPQVVTR